MAKDITYYFKRQSKCDFDLSKLPPSISQATIKAVRKEVNEIVNPRGDGSEDGEASNGSKRGFYIKISGKEKAIVGEYAYNHGVAAAMRHFKETGEFTKLKESTVRGWRDAYIKTYKDLKEESRKRPGSPVKVEELPEKRRGRPLLLGEEMEREVKCFIKASRELGTAVSTEVVMGTARGVVISHDANLLAENGGHIDITKDWAKRILHRMNMVKRQGTTKAKVMPSDFEQLKVQFLSDIRTMVMMEDIPGELIINWDQAGLKYVPVPDWTFEQKGAKRVEIVGLDDKRQITVLLSCTLTGKLLPTQVIYGGKTPACLPKRASPGGWYLCYTENHWSNEETMMAYLSKILLPYVVSTRRDLNLPSTHPCLVIFDQFKAQTTQRCLKALEDNNILFAEVPANCTDRLQPLDLSVNKPIKSYMKRLFQLWYAEEVKKQLKGNSTAAKVIDLKLSILKPLGLKWLEEACHYIERNDFIRNGFAEAGITEVVDSLSSATNTQS